MILDKCKCYHEEYKRRFSNMIETPIVSDLVGICWGTKECELCTCGGDPSKCNFYSEKREGIKMKETEKLSTAEMWLKAQENGKSYIAGDKTYNRKEGFKYLGHEMTPSDFNASESFSAFDIFMNVNNWVEDPNVMTKTQAEEKFGITIIGD